MAIDVLFNPGGLVVIVWMLFAVLVFTILMGFLQIILMSISVEASKTKREKVITGLVFLACSILFWLSRP